MTRLAEFRTNPWQRRGLIAALLLALYAAAGFLLAPWLIERTLTGILAERLSLETRVERIGLNPFSLSLEVDELAVDDTDSRTLLSFDRLYVNFQLSSLFHWAWHFDEIHLIRPGVHFERLTETDTNLSELAARWAATADAEPEPTSAAPEAPAIPRLMIADLRIVDGTLSLVDQAVAEPFSTEFAPIHLALENFSTLPDSSGRQQVTISTESGAEVGLTGSLSVNPLTLDGEVRLEGTYTPLLFRYFRNELALPLTFEGGALAARLDYRIAMDDDGEIGVALSNLAGTLEGLKINQPDHPHLLELGRLTVEGGSFNWPEQTVQLERLAVNDVLVRLFREADGNYLPGMAAMTENTETPTEQGRAAVAEDAAGWQVSVAETTLNSGRVIHTDTTLENGVAEVSELNLSLRDFSLAAGRELPVSLSLALLTGGTLRLDGDLQLFPDLRLTSQLTASDLALAIAQPYLSERANIGIEDGRLSTTGDLAIGGEQPFSYQGDLQVNALSLIDRVQEEALFSWQRLAVDRLSALPTALELSRLSIDQPYARIEIERDGTTNIERTFVARTADAAPPPTTPADVSVSTDASDQQSPAAAFKVTIGETRISDGSADFTDLALPLPFQAAVTGIEGELSTFATGSRAASDVDLSGQVNEYGALNIEGSVSANDPFAATNITVDFDNVNLPRMTPYTIKFAGRAIDDGRTDLTLSYRLNEGTLDGDNRLVIRDLTLGEKVEQPGAMDLPLDMAVALLKDGEGNLDFSFPVTGSVDDPDFSYSGAVSKAFSNVIGGIVAAPFRLLGSLVGMAPDELEHIGFEPGDATITPPQRETLAKLAEALGQRPQLILEVAPVRNTPADSKAIAERLVDTEIESALQQSAEEDRSHTDALRIVLETLYDADPSMPARSELADTHSAEAADGTRQLDVPAYNAALRTALVEARQVADLDLVTLAQSRLDAIQAALTTLVALPESRLNTLPPEDVDLNEDGLVQMSLNVTIAD